MNDPDKIRRVSANFFFWQGLRFVPFGLALAIYGVLFTQPGNLGITGDYGVLITAGLFLFAWLAMNYIGKYYYRVYGSIQNVPGLHLRRERIKWWLVYPLITLAIAADLIWARSFVFSGITWALSTLAFWWSTGQGRRHYWLAIATLAAYSFAPMFGLIEPGKAAISWFFVLVGLVYVFCGLLDHAELTRLMGEKRKGANGLAV
jgi:hypothetical protein